MLGDDLWGGDFGLPSVDGWITCVARFRGDIVVGGRFRSIGGVAANNVARWDGAAWHPLGDGIEGYITLLTEFEGELLAGGDFQFVNGEFSPNLGRWDGHSWRRFGVLSGSYLCCYSLNALVVYRGELIAGGSFSPSHTGVYGLARWDGSSWSLFEGGVNGTVETLLATGDSLYVAGSFDSAGGHAASNVALWDGGAWSALGAGITFQPWYGMVHSMALFRGKLYVAGFFESAGGVPATYLVAWDGSGWSSLDHIAGYTTDLVVDGELLDLAVFDGVVQWDGDAVRATLTGITGGASALLCDERGLVMVGEVTIGSFGLDTVDGFQVAQWDGSAWKSVGSWNPGMKGLATFGGRPAGVECLAIYRGELVAGGTIEVSGDGEAWKVVGPIPRWDGSNWSSLQPGWPWVPGPAAALRAEEDTLYVGGEFWDLGPSGYTRRPVWRWDSSHWSVLDTLSLQATCFERFGGMLVLGTVRQSSLDNRDAGVYALQGDAWVPLGVTSGVDGHDGYHGVKCAALYRGSLVVGGPFTSIEGTQAGGIAVWDGTSWNSIGGTWPGHLPRPEVNALASYRERLFAVGGFRGGGAYAPTAPIAMWNGSEWRAVPGISGWGTGLAVIRGRVFVAGQLRIGSDPEVVTVAMLDGETWLPLGSGVNGTVRGLLEFNGALYAGGSFSFAGAKSAFSIARWNGFLPTPRTRTPWLTEGRPNPFRAGSEFSFRLEEQASVRIEVHDVRGRRVAVLEDGFRVPGTHSFRWNGRDRSGREVPAGVYFVSVRTRDGHVTSRKVIRLR